MTQTALFPVPPPTSLWARAGIAMMGDGEMPPELRCAGRGATPTEPKVVHVPWRRRTEPCGCVARTRQTPRGLSVVIETPCRVHVPGRGR